MKGEESTGLPSCCRRTSCITRIFKVTSPVVGFKLLHDAMQRVPGIWYLLKDLGTRLVHTYRANYLDAYISFQLATVNQAFTCWYGRLQDYPDPD